MIIQAGSLRVAGVPGVPEGVDDLEPLEHLLLAVLARLRRHPRAQLLGHLVHVEPPQQLAHGRRADVGEERLRRPPPAPWPQLQVLLLVEQLAELHLLLARVDDHVVGVVDHPLEVT
jgi:hypothetical protein